MWLEREWRHAHEHEIPSSRSIGVRVVVYRPQRNLGVSPAQNAWVDGIYKSLPVRTIKTMRPDSAVVVDIRHCAVGREE
jgi:hypothetical protein